jgi:hypothetical protein
MPDACDGASATGGRHGSSASVQSDVVREDLSPSCAGRSLADAPSRCSPRSAPRCGTGRPRSRSFAAPVPRLYPRMPASDANSRSSFSLSFLAVRICFTATMAALPLSRFGVGEGRAIAEPWSSRTSGLAAPC